MVLTLWGKQAEDFDVSSQPVVVLKGAKLSDFGGRSLSTTIGTVLMFDPDMSETKIIRCWFDNVGRTMASTSISNQGSLNSAYKTFAEAKLENLGGGDKPDYYTVKALVALINKERVLYQACPSQDCNKKVFSHLHLITFS